MMVWFMDDINYFYIELLVGFSHLICQGDTKNYEESQDNIPISYITTIICL